MLCSTVTLQPSNSIVTKVAVSETRTMLHCVCKAPVLRNAGYFAVAVIAPSGDNAVASITREECHRRSQASLHLLRELLRRDYAIGYLLLGWMLRTTWSVAPAIAMLLGLPQPDARTATAQLPALLTWMLTGSSRSRRPSSAGNAAAGAAAAELESDEDEQMLLQLLSAEELQQLQEQLVGPTAALASLANFMRAQQTLAGAPATAQQVCIGRRQNRCGCFSLF
jgi:hypothetical protein